MLGEARFGEVSGIVHKIATFHLFHERQSCSFREAFAGWIAFQNEKLPQPFPDHAAECKRAHFPAHHSYDADEMRPAKSRRGPYRTQRVTEIENRNEILAMSVLPLAEKRLALRNV